MPEETLSVCFCPDCGSMRFEARLSDGREITYGIDYEHAMMLLERLTSFKRLFERRRRAGKTTACCVEVPRHGFH